MNDKQEIDRRLKVVEAALGIDLDTTAACSGDPTACPATPCREDRCPVKNGLPARTARAVKTLEWELAVVKATLAVMARHGRIPPEVAEAATLTAQRDIVSRRLAALRETVGMVGEGPLRESFDASVKKATDELTALEAALAEKERVLHVASDKG